MLVSIYLPTRNRQPLLARAVDSVLGQTHGEIELLVVDDGSSDGTANYLREKALTDRRLTVFRNDRRLGAPASRNIAIRASRGAFVTGLDDDDFFHRERVAKLIEAWQDLAARGIEPSFLYTQIHLLRQGRIDGIHRQRPVVRYEDMFASNQVGNQIFAPRDRFLAAGLFDERMPAWQDLDLFLGILQKFGPAYLVERPLYAANVDRRPDRISSDEAGIRAASALISAKHAGGDRRRRADLFVMQFQDYYAFRPTAKDWARYLRLGSFPRGLRRMLRASAKPLRAGYGMATGEDRQ